MLTQPLSTSFIGSKISRVACPTPASDQFGAITGHAGLVATEFTYKKDEEIYGEDEPSEYVYQVISGAVRSYKLLSDGRRQIGTFHLPGDVFGLESGAVHRLAAEAI
ncbi:MAG TPA: cyclic nucleotide-binding domain-containing protein, partial [Bradyrhizobium sp.]|nr:cyclic nucleotide-binding domain-containing protein [Bradyrhizobium sp.]